VGTAFAAAGAGTGRPAWPDSVGRPKNHARIAATAAIAIMAAIARFLERAGCNFVSEADPDPALGSFR